MVHYTARWVAATVQAMGCQIGGYVGIAAPNSVAFAQALLGLMWGGFVAVPLSPGLSDQNIRAIATETGMRVLLAEPGRVAKRFEAALPPVVVVAACVGSQQCFWDWLTQHQHQHRPAAPHRRASLSTPGAQPHVSARDPALVVYTSGSTGAPKGVVMTGAALLTEVIDISSHQKTAVEICDSPLYSGSGPSSILTVIAQGGRIAVVANLARMFELCPSIGPTAISMVPQQCAELYKAHQQRVASGTTIADANDEFRASLGPRVESIMVGGATPIPKIQAWLATVFTQCGIFEGYASTETGIITSSSSLEPDDIGRIAPGVAVKLEDWGSFKTTDKPHPRGQICVKSAVMSSGYLSRPELTKASWGADGYYRTGDVGMQPDSNHLLVIDRCKNFFKLKTGEWVSPERIEGIILASCAAIKRIFVSGTGTAAGVVAIIVPSPTSSPVGMYTSKPSADKGAKSGATAEDTTAAKMVAAIAANAEKDGLSHFEVPSSVHVCEPGFDFSVENGLLTSTFKLCRRNLAAQFQGPIKQMFDKQESQKLAMETKSTVLDLLALVLTTTTGRARTIAIGPEGVDPSPKTERAWRELDWTSLQVPNHCVFSPCMQARVLMHQQCLICYHAVPSLCAADHIKVLRG